MLIRAPWRNSIVMSVVALCLCRQYEILISRGATAHANSFTGLPVAAAYEATEIVVESLCQIVGGQYSVFGKLCRETTSLILIDLLATAALVVAALPVAGILFIAAVVAVALVRILTKAGRKIWAGIQRIARSVELKVPSVPRFAAIKKASASVLRCRCSGTAQRCRLRHSETLEDEDKKTPLLDERTVDEKASDHSTWS